MPRLALVGLVLFAFQVSAAEPTPLDKSLAIQRAMAEAKVYLAAGQPADAAKSLEGVIANINGDADFLVLLRQAYGDELKKQKLSRSPDSTRIADLDGKLAILNKSEPKAEPKAEPKPEPKAEPKPEPKAEPKPAAPPKIEEAPATADPELLKRAGELFNLARNQPAKYAEAASLFSKAYADRAELTADQLAAWSYCRVKVAADAWNKSNREAAATAAAVREIEEALALAPNHPDLQAAGKKLIADVGGKPSAAKPKGPTISEGNWVALESESFRVRFQGAPEFAKELLAKAEEARKAIFTKWSSPAATPWSPKCDLVLHPTAAEFAAATNGPAAGTGHAFVKLDAKQVTDRRIDLRADDATTSDDALPRELTYVILADLFPDREPPKWAAIGMAVLATATESDRCGRTLARCFKAGELIAMPAFLELKGPSKPESVTAYYVESASVVEHLVKRKDAKTFRIFLMDAGRYGLEKALDRQYGYATLKEFDDDWRRANLTTARGQKP